MPAATVGAAYASRRHLERSRKAQRVYQERGEYSFERTLTYITKFSGLEKSLGRNELEDREYNEGR